MTYNFDPERWYDIERRHLERQRDAGDLSQDRFGTALNDLQSRYEQMMDHLNSVTGFSNSNAPSVPIEEK